MEGGAAVEVDAVDVDAFVEQILNSLDVAAAGHEEELHGGVQVLRHGELGVAGAGAAANRIERGLAAEAEALVVPARIQRGLARELPREVPPQRPRRELPRDAALQLRGNAFHAAASRRRILQRNKKKELVRNENNKERALHVEMEATLQVIPKRK